MENSCSDLGRNEAADICLPDPRNPVMTDTGTFPSPLLPMTDFALTIKGGNVGAIPLQLQQA
jgi:hypothetical protein